MTDETKTEFQGERLTKAVLISKEPLGPPCDHSSCDERTCPWDMLASGYWEERRQNYITLHGTARGKTAYI